MYQFCKKIRKISPNERHLPTSAYQHHEEKDWCLTAHLFLLSLISCSMLAVSSIRHAGRLQQETCSVPCMSVITG